MKSKIYQKVILLLFLPCTIVFSQQHDKWIVVTTIQYPTAALEKLAKIPDWHLVVVGDKKTPRDWYLDNCVYLSVEDQEKLPYNIIKYLPWNHYSRKNIGYLYAIEHGATIIYETDDDNTIIDDSVLYLPEQTKMLQCQSEASSFNPYAYFGQPDVWPRGYPLKKSITLIPYELITQLTTIPIQQGLVNNDPDVDAIFRLTHLQEITFDSEQQPISLPAKIMCPFNSQNTVFHYSAFWGLLLPITTSFRVCDIWRSYWVQRILWDIDASLCFLPPTAIQYRNDHNLLTDFEDELDLYLKAEHLITALNLWNSNKEFLEERIKNLMQNLVEQGFFKEKENLLLNAWFDDLRNLNYSMPLVSLH